ncbi:MAG: DUF721 domain-containing protein [Phycisphaerae bacterium]|nr:DUF721 domain-containing protein [Phycisphaerae bacterium]
MDERQLRWIMQNRRRKEVEGLGEVAKRLQQRAPLRGPLWRARVASVIETVADGRLAEQVSLASLRNGVLTLEVADVALIGALRMQWHQHLLTLLAAELPELGIADVRFRFGAGDGMDRR